MRDWWDDWIAGDWGAALPLLYGVLLGAVAGSILTAAAMGWGQQ